MGRIWLCEDQMARRPLMVNAGINLYSFEELCYYLYQNVESVEESFFNELLCQWLAEELDRQELSQQLLEGLEQEKSGCWCLEQILNEGGFYNIEQMNAVLQIAESMEKKTPVQRAKLRGDRFLKSAKYQEALLEYLKALEQESDLFFQGQVWHNLGIVYARQFLFAPAAECFKRAYETGQQTESSEAYLLALAYRDGQVPDQGGEKMKNLLEKLQEKKEAGDRGGYEEKIEEMLQELRTEYRKSE